MAEESRLPKRGEGAREQAQVRFEKTGAQPVERARGDAPVVVPGTTVAAHTAVADLRLERGRRDTEAAGPSRKPNSKLGSAAKSAPSWGDLNRALNALVKEGLILGYSTGKVGANDVASIEAAVSRGADQAEVVRRIRESLPEALSNTKIRTRLHD